MSGQQGQTQENTKSLYWHIHTYCSIDLTHLRTTPKLPPGTAPANWDRHQPMRGRVESFAPRGPHLRVAIHTRCPNAAKIAYRKSRYNCCRVHLNSPRREAKCLDIDGRHPRQRPWDPRLRIDCVPGPGVLAVRQRHVGRRERVFAFVLGGHRRYAHDDFPVGNQFSQCHFVLVLFLALWPGSIQPVEFMLLRLSFVQMQEGSDGALLSL